MQTALTPKGLHPWQRAVFKKMQPLRGKNQLRRQIQGTLRETWAEGLQPLRGILSSQYVAPNLCPKPAGRRFYVKVKP